MDLSGISRHDPAFKIDLFLDVERSPYSFT